MGRGVRPARSPDALQRENDALRRENDALRQENDAQRSRISRLNEAILRINGSLDLGTVLQEVVDSARALTGARYGAITTIDARRAGSASSSPPA